MSERYLNQTFVGESRQRDLAMQQDDTYEEACLTPQGIIERGMAPSLAPPRTPAVKTDSIQDNPIRNANAYTTTTSRNKLDKIAIVIISVSAICALIMSTACVVIILQKSEKVDNAHKEILEGITKVSNAVQIPPQQTDAPKAASEEITKLSRAIQFVQQKIEVIQNNVVESRNSCQAIGQEILDKSSRLNYIYPTPIRLAGGSQRAGRVEVFHNEEWGTICDDLWDIRDAKVICRMLGYRSALSAPTGARYGQGTGQIWLDNVICTGSELSIIDCTANPRGVENCGHSEDASVECI